MSATELDISYPAAVDFLLLLPFCNQPSSSVIKKDRERETDRLSSPRESAGHFIYRAYIESIQILRRKQLYFPTICCRKVLQKPLNLKMEERLQ